MESWEWNKIYTLFSDIRVELTWESDGAGDTWHSYWYEMIQITISWGGEFKSSEANIVESFIINNLSLISIFDKLMYWKSCIIWFYNCVWDFWRWEYWESTHLSVRIFFSNFRDEKATHSGSSTSTERVTYGKSLKAVTSISFFSTNIHNGIN